MTPAPGRTSYDVVIVGGAMIGSAVAWFLSANADFDGTVLVVERDPTYERSSTARTNSCMRQQFSNELNVRISQFGAEFVKGFRDQLGGDPDIPELVFDPFGYLYLAADEATADRLRASQRVQAGLGVGTRLLTPDEIATRFPFIDVEGLVLGSYNDRDEGYFDGATMFDQLRRTARANGVEYATDDVVDLERSGPVVDAVVLASGRRIGCGTVVNAAGPRASSVAALAGLDLPVEARKRYSFAFRAAEGLTPSPPLIIDPTGVHVRPDSGPTYLAGCGPDVDRPVDVDDLTVDHSIWEGKIWPALANRIPAFERLKVISRWAGHYAFNTLDRNAVVGPHPEVTNFVFANGFSGHGLQQAPAMGRGVSELITYGRYRSLDLTPLGYARIVDGIPFEERAVI